MINESGTGPDSLEETFMKAYDVIVIGGGTAGAVAAVAAARGGAKTLIVEKDSHLGGTAVYGIPFLGVVSGSGEIVNHGMVSELIDRLQSEDFSFGIARGANWNVPDKYEFSLVPFDPEGLKFVLQEMCEEAGVEVLFNSILLSAAKEGSQVTQVTVCTKAGLEELKAKAFIDCTGDGDLNEKAGGSFQERGALQNSSILFHIGGVDLEAFHQALEDEDHILGKGSWHTRIIEKSKSEGAPKSLVHMAGHLKPFDDERTVTFTAVSYRDGEIYLNATRTAGVDGTDPWQVSRAEFEERRHVLETFRAMKKTVPGFANATLLYTSPLGIRQSRNILGDYTITREDVVEGRSFEDEVARGAYPIDIHDPKGGRTQFQFIKDGGSYEIPYRAMLPKGIDGIIVAGRCISADHNAHGTIRIMGCVLNQGEAAGTAAALCIREGKLPRQLDGKTLKSALLG